jgi:hypothetical protein
MADDPFAMISKFNATNAAAPQQPAIDLGFGGGDAAAPASVGGGAGMLVDFGGGGAAAAAEPASPKAATTLHTIATLEAAAPTGARPPLPLAPTRALSSRSCVGSAADDEAMTLHRPLLAGDCCATQRVNGLRVRPVPDADPDDRRRGNHGLCHRAGSYPSSRLSARLSRPRRLTLSATLPCFVTRTDHSGTGERDGLPEGGRRVRSEVAGQGHCLSHERCEHVGGERLPVARAETSR